MHMGFSSQVGMTGCDLTKYYFWALLTIQGFPEKIDAGYPSHAHETGLQRLSSLCRRDLKLALHKILLWPQPGREFPGKTPVHPKSKDFLTSLGFSPTPEPKV
jgi:hypothetical protein